MVNTHPHQEAQVYAAGTPLEEAQAAMVMVHGRGASAGDILSLTGQFDASGFAYIAPQAIGHTWYPHPFTAPVEANEPWLSSALQLVGDLVNHVEQAGIPAENIILLGFSQGACLTLEFAARNARRYGGVVALSGGLIGADDAPRDYEGSLEGTPVFLGCSDVDPHIKLERVKHSTQVLRDLGGNVTERIYPGMGHTINQDEIEHVRGIMAALVTG